MATKVELERENRILRERFEKIGAAAIEFAEEQGYCDEVENFLRDWDIPFPNSKPVEFVVTLRFTATPEGRKPLDVIAIEAAIETYSLENAFAYNTFSEVEVEVTDIYID